MLIDGRTSVPITAVPIVAGATSSGAHRITNITIQADPDNTDYVVLGGPNVVAAAGTRTGIRLDPGDVHGLTATDAADVFLRANSGTQIVTWHAKAI
jgi:hypothetical protein